MKRVIKGNIITYFVLLAMAVTAMILIKRFSVNSSQRDYMEISADTLRVVTNVYFNDNIDATSLVNYELAEIIGEESGLPFKIDTISSLTESITLLNNKRYDIIARPIFATTTSKEKLMFSNSFSKTDNNLVVVQRGDGDIKNNLNLAKKTISIVDDESIKMVINNIAYEIGDSIYTDVWHNRSAEQLIIMVADSTIDYAVCGVTIAKRMKEFLPQINIDTKISIPIPQAWGVRHGSPVLRDSLNLWFERVKNNGKFKILMNKYGF